MIVVVGADNTGKTTLVDHLKAEFKLPEIPRYHTLPPTDYVDWYRWVMKHLEAQKERIADRFFIDEFVYGPIKRGEIGLTGPKMEMLKDMFDVERPLIILCHTSLETIAKTYGEREQYPTLGEIEKIQGAFLKVLRDETLPFHKCPIHVWDFTRDSSFTAVNRATDNYLKARGW